MESIGEIVRRLRTLGRSTDMEKRMGDEVRFHLEQQTEKNIRAGMAPDEARLAALMRFGGVESVKESVRDEYRPALVEDFWRDLRYGARVLTRAPGFAIVSILTLAMGIGAATAVFSLVEGVLLRPLPFPEPDRIVRLFQLDATGRRMNVSEPNFDDWKARTHGFVSMAETALSASVPVSGGREPIVTSGAAVSREFFDVMGVTPAVGRGFLPEEQRVGAAPVAIISHRFWTARLGSAPLEGQALRINDELHQVVGVMPEGFAYPAGADFWTPREVAPPQRSRTAHNFQVVARLADDVPLATANGELSAVSRAMKGEHGDATWMADAAAVPLQEQLTANARPTLVALFGAAVLLLVIACLNVSNLQLARIATRRRELALRMAIGAGRGRILRQMLAEAFLLSTLATVVGAGLAAAGVRAIVAAQPGSVPRLDTVGVNGTVLAFACAVAAVTALALGLATVLRTSKYDLRAALAGGPRTDDGDRGRARAPGPRCRAGGRHHRAADRRVTAGAQLRAAARVDRVSHQRRRRARPGVAVLSRCGHAIARGVVPAGVAGTPGGVARRGVGRPRQRLPSRRRTLYQRPVPRDDARGRVQEFRRCRPHRRAGEGPRRSGRVSRGECKLLRRDGHPAPSRAPVRRR
jgi:hypothetical protein